MRIGSADLMAATMAVRELPPRLSRSSQVRDESRYGMKSPLPLAFFLSLDSSASAEMTLPSVVSDLLMLAPSFRRAPDVNHECIGHGEVGCHAPVAPVDSARSLPAKSTRLILLTLSVTRPDTGSVVRWVSTMLNTACERLLVSFMLVAATVRALLPSSIRLAMSPCDRTTSEARSCADI